MILFFENMTNDEKKLILENENKYLDNCISTFKAQKSTLLLCMNQITLAVDKITSVDQPNLLDKTLTDLKDILEKMHFNEDNYTKLRNIIRKIYFDDKSTYQYIDEYNSLLIVLQNLLNENSINFENFIRKTLLNCEFIFDNPSVPKKKESEIISCIEEPITEQQIISEKPQNKVNNIEHIKTINESENQNNKISKDNIETEENFDENDRETNVDLNEVDIELTDNNCLLISEKENKVFLPYKLADLQVQLQGKNNQYKNVQELIKKEYILPLEQFKSPKLARFKETYHLMKNKENSSFLEAISLSLELSFNSVLNPAVIAACKNQDELDIYLDCLYENELDKFKIFEIKYDMAPMKK